MSRIKLSKGTLKGYPELKKFGLYRKMTDQQRLDFMLMNNREKYGFIYEQIGIPYDARTGQVLDWEKYFTVMKGIPYRWDAKNGCYAPATEIAHEA